MKQLCFLIAACKGSECYGIQTSLCTCRRALCREVGEITSSSRLRANSLSGLIRSAVKFSLWNGLTKYARAMP